MYKVCQIIFSTNRLEYLTKTLSTLDKLDWEGCEVHKIFVDDYPKGRNNLLISTLVQSYGFTELILHEENKGLSATWTEIWNLIRDRDYDYVWHMEDDVEILYPLKMRDLIELLQLDPELSMVNLKRQPWYPGEVESSANELDWFFKTYRYERETLIFSIMASMYPISRVRFDYKTFLKESYPDNNYHEVNFNEGLVGKSLYESQRLITGVLKTQEGRNYINHIGEYFVGKRVLPNEPHYEMFANYDPNRKYDSKTGNEYS